MVNDYDCEILYHPGKTNVVADALIRKAMSSSIRGICLRMVFTSTLMDLIKKAQVEGLRKENWKAKRIRGYIPLFFRDSQGLLTQCGRFWVPTPGGVR